WTAVLSETEAAVAAPLYPPARNGSVMGFHPRPEPGYGVKVLTLVFAFILVVAYAVGFVDALSQEVDAFVKGFNRSAYSADHFEEHLESGEVVVGEDTVAIIDGKEAKKGKVADL